MTAGDTVSKLVWTGRLNARAYFFWVEVSSVPARDMLRQAKGAEALRDSLDHYLLECALGVTAELTRVRVK